MVDPDVAVKVGADGFESRVGAVGVGSVKATSLKVEVPPLVVEYAS